MDFSISRETLEETERFKEGWFNFSFQDNRVEKQSALRQALLAEEIAKASPGVAVTVLAHQDLGLTGLWLFGASSVIFEHPVHKFPLDAWASSLGEGTQDVQKLVIFREMMKRIITKTRKDEDTKEDGVD